MKLMLLVFFAWVLSDCASRMKCKDILVCNSASARLFADKRMKKRGFNLSRYRVNISDGKDHYLVVYAYSVNYRTGSGGKVLVREGNCRKVGNVPSDFK